MASIPSESPSRLALVTGAARGIGFATARCLAEKGSTVVLADIDAEAGEEAVGRILAEGLDASFRHLDAGRPEEWSKLAAELKQLDVLVSNASHVHLAPAHELSDEDWSAQVQTCLSATFYAVRSLVPLLLEAEGSVVVTSSVHAMFGLPGHPAYAAAKGGLVALTRQLAVEYGPAVRVNAVLPGPIMTEAWEGVPTRDVERSARATVAGRLGKPEEVAGAIAFLASAEASYITGASLVVDGGWSISKDSA